MTGREKISNAPIFFSKRDQKKIRRMNGRVSVISTVCPDYPRKGGVYVFSGSLGEGVSLTAELHIKYVPILLNKLTEIGLNPCWLILVADLPELVSIQEEFYLRAAGSREEYIRRCDLSVKAIERSVNGAAQTQVATFSTFYGALGIKYLEIQESVAQNILAKQEVDKKFNSSFYAFMQMRRGLAERFRGRRLSDDEMMQAAAHGMSLYVTHGTLLRRIYLGQNLIVINHETTNLQNFFLCNLVEDGGELQNTPKFPLGVLEGNLY